MTALLQRPLRGSRISSFYPVKTLPSLASLDSAFQLQEYISLLIRLDVHDVDTIVSLPGKAAGKEKEADVGDLHEDRKGEDDKERKNDITVDEACWIYEQLRRLAQDLSHPLITMLQQECTRASCPEMKAGEWLYLCVAHGTDGAMEQCCAIDYILHTLDSATALLNSPRAFPSRLQIPTTSHRHFSSLARRLGRIFAHAYFHHREAFEQAEAESSLYARFLALTSKFELVPPEFLVIPPRMSMSEGNERKDIDVQPPRLLAAGLHPQSERNVERLRERGSVAGSSDRVVSSPSIGDRAQSISPPGLGSESPRKYGRSRTDTMVFSDASSIVEELARAGDEDTETHVESPIGAGDEKISILERDPPADAPEIVEVSSPEQEEPFSSVHTRDEAAHEEPIHEKASDPVPEPPRPELEQVEDLPPFVEPIKEEAPSAPAPAHAPTPEPEAEHTDIPEVVVQAPEEVEPAIVEVPKSEAPIPEPTEVESHAEPPPSEPPASEPEHLAEVPPEAHTATPVTTETAHEAVEDIVHEATGPSMDPIPLDKATEVEPVAQPAEKVAEPSASVSDVIAAVESVAASSLEKVEEGHGKEGEKEEAKDEGVKDEVKSQEPVVSPEDTTVSTDAVHPAEAVPHEKVSADVKEEKV